MTVDHSLPMFDPSARPLAGSTLEPLAAFARQWSGMEGSEQQLSQFFLNGLCDALGTPRPYSGGVSVDDYCFEKHVDVPDRKERGRIDLYKRGCFVLEAKCGRNGAGESTDPLGQLADVLTLVQASTAALDAESVAAHFRRAPRRRAADLLERLATRRLVVLDDTGRYRALV
ncbi:MAG: hypothetical protein AMXMBFR64_43050 [Myxococcales bacterium]